MRGFGLFGVCCTLLAGSALACGTEERCIGAGESQFGVALGYGRLDNPLVAAPDTQFYAYPQFAWYGERFYFDNGDFGYTLVDDGHWLINLTTGFSQDSFYFQDWGGSSFALPVFAISRVSYEYLPEDMPVDDPQAQPGAAEGGASAAPPAEEPVLVGERQLAMPHAWAWLAGPEVQYFWDADEVAVRLLQDVSTVHNGTLLNLRYGHRFEFGRWTLSTRLGLDWKSRELVDHYYSVTPETNPVSYTAYDAKATVDSIVQLSASYPLDAHWRVLVQGEYRRLGDGIADSPRVTERNLTHYFLGLGYAF